MLLLTLVNGLLLSLALLDPSNIETCPCRDLADIFVLIFAGIDIPWGEHGSKTAGGGYIFDDCLPERSLACGGGQQLDSQDTAYAISWAKGSWFPVKLSLPSTNK